jgi:hypothetical protein
VAEEANDADNHQDEAAEDDVSLCEDGLHCWIGLRSYVELMVRSESASRVR